jgi:hypothetical protein
MSPWLVLCYVGAAAGTAHLLVFVSCVCWCACIPVAVLWKFMDPLLVLLGQVGIMLFCCYICVLSDM